MYSFSPNNATLGGRISSPRIGAIWSTSLWPRASPVASSRSGTARNWNRLLRAETKGTGDLRQGFVDPTQDFELKAAWIMRCAAPKFNWPLVAGTLYFGHVQ